MLFGEFLFNVEWVLTLGCDADVCRQTMERHQPAVRLAAETGAERWPHTLGVTSEAEELADLSSSAALGRTC